MIREKLEVSHSILSHFIDIITLLVQECIKGQDDILTNEINEYLFMENLIQFNSHIYEYWEKKFNEPFPKTKLDEYEASWEAKKAEIISDVSKNIRKIRENHTKQGDEFGLYQ